MRIRRVSGSMVVTIPADIVKAYDIRDGDVAIVYPHEKGLLIEIKRRSDKV
jgi:antitoxin component of MazEF toxin-antitoxin module